MLQWLVVPFASLWCHACTGVHDALRTLYADSPDIVEKLVGVELDLASVRHKWWLGSAESEGHVVDRIDDMLNQVSCAIRSALSCDWGA